MKLWTFAVLMLSLREKIVFKNLSSKQQSASYPMVFLASCWFQIKFGAITIAMFCGVILFTSWFRHKAAKNLIRYLRLSLWDSGNSSMTSLNPLIRSSGWALKAEKITWMSANFRKLNTSRQHSSSGCRVCESSAGLAFLSNRIWVPQRSLLDHCSSARLQRSSSLSLGSFSFVALLRLLNWKKLISPK